MGSVPFPNREKIKTGNARLSVLIDITFYQLAISVVSVTNGKFFKDKAKAAEDSSKNTVNTLKDSNLMKELAESGVKYTPDDVVMVTKTPDGKLVWLEKGNSKAGLNHIIEAHGLQFQEKGITSEEIPNYMMKAVNQGNIIGYQGTKNPRPIFEFWYEGQKQRAAVQIGSNGFIVGANLKSMED